MKKRFYVNKFVITANLIIWFLYTIMTLPYLSGAYVGLTYPITSLLFNVVLVFSLFCACFYYINPYFIQQDAYFRWVLTLLALVAAVIFARNALDSVAYTGIYFNGQPFRPIGIRLINTIIVVVLTAIFSFLEISEARKQAALKEENLRLSAELGFLLTGNLTNTTAQFTTNKTDVVDFSPAPVGGQKGPGMGIFYDDRLAGFLGVENTGAVRIRRVGGFTQSGR